MHNRGKSIGIALSGGGHRATLFGLGALLYLVDSGKNKEVTAISSVSGGSLTNAFISTLSQAFSTFNDPQSFDKEAARLSAQIAGSLFWFWTTVVTYCLLLGGWLVFAVIPGLNSSMRLLLPHQLLFIASIFVWAIVIGPRSGGTFWAWWGTWCYVGLLIPLGIMGLLLLCYAALTWGFVCLIALGIVLLFRCKVAELAFAATLIPGGVHNRRRLCSISNTVRHIFCATEVRSGRHAYFSHDLVYIPWLGLQDAKQIPLSLAVQAPDSHLEGVHIDGESPVGFLNRRPQVRILSGIPFWSQDLRPTCVLRTFACVTFPSLLKTSAG
jgi:hypothetical protein